MGVKNQLRSAIIIVVMLGLLAGCGATFRVNMPKQAVTQVSSTDVILNINQSEIYAEVKRSGIAAAGGGGLLLALIDSAVESNRTENAENAIAPVRNALLEYDVNKKIEDGMKENLQQVSWIKFNNLSTSTIKDEEQKAAERRKFSGNMVLDIKTSYYLTYDFKTLVVESIVTGYPNDENLVKVAKDKNADTDEGVLFRNKYTARGYASIPSEAPISEAANIWAQNNGEKLHKALDDAINEMLRELVAGLKTEGASGQVASN